MNVLVADDHPMVREALCALVSRSDASADVHGVGDFPSLLREASRLAPDVALVDLNMPGMDGLEGLRRLRQQCPGLPVLMVSGQADPDTARSVIRAGAAGFLPKTTDTDHLLDALRRVQAGQVCVPTYGALTALVPGDWPPPPCAAALTARQKEVLVLLMDGTPNRAIGERLGLTEGTVKIHVASILRALRARNRTEAVVRARDWGLLQDRV